MTTPDKGWLCPICQAWNPSTSITCANTPQHDVDEQDARDAATRRSLAARVAVNTSWAMTPNRTERTAPARARSPIQFDYWLAKAERDHPDANPQAQRDMADSAWKAQQQKNSLAALKARQAKRAKTRRASAA